MSLKTRLVASLASFGLVVAIGGAALLFAPAASATPLTQAGTVPAAQGSDVTLVRDGCGRGRRYSHRRHRCVSD